MSEIASLSECEDELYEVNAKLEFLVKVLDSDDNEFCSGLGHILREIKYTVLKVADCVSSQSLQKT